MEQNNFNETYTQMLNIPSQFGKYLYLNKKEKYISQDVAEFMQKIENIVENPEFLNQILFKLNFIKKFGYFELQNNLLVGKTKIASHPYIFKLSLNQDNVSYEVQFLEDIHKGEYNLVKPIYIKYYNSECIKMNKTFDKFITKQIHCFNEYHIETFYAEEKTKESYEIDEQTNELVLAKPDLNKNYTDKKYYWLLTRYYVLKREILTYQQDNDFLKQNEVNDCQISQVYNKDTKYINLDNPFYDINMVYYRKYIMQQIPNSVLYKEYETKKRNRVL